MGRTKGAVSKKVSTPAAYGLTPEERLRLIAGLLIDIVCEELWIDS